MTQSILEIKADLGLQTQYHSVHQFRLDLWRQSLDDFSSGSYSEGIFKGLDWNILCQKLIDLSIVEKYWAIPGVGKTNELIVKFQNGEFTAFELGIKEVLSSIEKSISPLIKSTELRHDSVKPKYFEVLFVGEISAEKQTEIRNELTLLIERSLLYKYDFVFVESTHEAIYALHANDNIQACIIFENIVQPQENLQNLLDSYFDDLVQIDDAERADSRSYLLTEIKEFRPELDIFLWADHVSEFIESTEERWGSDVRNLISSIEEAHTKLLEGIERRSETPFYSALKNYSERPATAFHATPFSRGESVFNSNWIDDFGEFYGQNLFLTETSATNGGLDSLQQPIGSLKRAQELAAKAFGANQTFFSTNGTSTSNKIVLQALLQPDDIVLIERNCHKSHHYGLVLAGATSVYLDSYPVPNYWLYGAVPLNAIVTKLKELKSRGELAKVKLLILTNCTFDGIVYNVENIMEEVLSIKPDMVFLWDEAWFAFATFNSVFRKRTAMYVAGKLEGKYKSPSYRKEYEEHRTFCENNNIKVSGWPDPNLVKVRVYATQSTHKTLSSFRQGSMIHINDAEFNTKVKDAFYEAYMTHTSTSANYQILASMDVGRKQAVIEGASLVKNSIEMASLLREKIKTDERLMKYFDVHSADDLIPQEFRMSDSSTQALNAYRCNQKWTHDEFVLDPTKVSLYIGRTGIDGETFKNKYLMGQFNIQVNKTTKNTVLFITNIGTTRSAIFFLVEALIKISRQLDEDLEELDEGNKDQKQLNIKYLTSGVSKLPEFGTFHPSFQVGSIPSAGNLRGAFFKAYDEEKIEFISLKNCAMRIERGMTLVSASFVIPYPPGFPVLVPGQVITEEITELFRSMRQSEVHGYNEKLGLKIFKMNSSDMNTELTACSAHSDSLL